MGRSAAPLMRHLAADRRRKLVAVDPDPSRAGVRVLLRIAPQSVPVVVRAGRLPFPALSFDTIVIHQSLHTMPLTEALPEWARTLKPGGHLSISYYLRDNSVPWVRKLASLLQAVDPNAMSDDFGESAVEALASSPHFPVIERKNFRVWVPISRVDLLQMVSDRFPTIDDRRRSDLLGEVGKLYESHSRVLSPLMLPYHVSCWKGYANHSGLRDRLRRPDDGLSIRL